MRVFVFITALLITLTSFSQSEKIKNLEENYLDLKEKTETYEDYKVIRETRLDEFWNQTIDEFKSIESELRKAQSRIDQLSTQLVVTQDKIKELETIISEKEFASTHISVLGIQFAKGTFIFISFLIILVISVILIVGYLRFQSYRQMVGRTMKENEEINEEYEAFRHRSVERERKLARELQDEKNKMDEILTKG